MHVIKNTIAHLLGNEALGPKDPTRFEDERVQTACSLMNQLYTNVGLAELQFANDRIDPTRSHIDVALAAQKLADLQSIEVRLLKNVAKYLIAKQALDDTLFDLGVLDSLGALE